MNEFLKFIQDYWQTIASIISWIVVIVAYVDVKVTKKLVNNVLARAKVNGSYLVCPHCGAKVELKDLDNLYLPSGLVDNDLDGKPDNPSKD